MVLVKSCLHFRPEGFGDDSGSIIRDTRSYRGQACTNFAVNGGFANFVAMRRYIYIYMMVLAAGLMMLLSADCCYGQRAKKKSAEAGMKKTAAVPTNPDGKVIMEYIVEGQDTIYIDQIKASKVYSRLPKMKGREWRKYYRLVHNFSKAYPYALVARKLVTEADSTMAAEKMGRLKRERYVNKVQKELFDVFEGQMRKMTVSQGALLMKLIDREVGKSSYNIIKDYKSGMAAGFWQGIAKLFGTDLKKPYDPEGEDRQVEELVEIWEAGDFPAFYWSIFWKDPPEMPIPEKYK